MDKRQTALKQNMSARIHKQLWLYLIPAMLLVGSITLVAPQYLEAHTRYAALVEGHDAQTGAVRTEEDTSAAATTPLAPTVLFNGMAEKADQPMPDSAHHVLLADTSGLDTPGAETPGADAPLSDTAAVSGATRRANQSTSRFVFPVWRLQDSVTHELIANPPTATTPTHQAVRPRKVSAYASSRSAGRSSPSRESESNVAATPSAPMSNSQEHAGQSHTSAPDATGESVAQDESDTSSPDESTLPPITPQPRHQAVDDLIAYLPTYHPGPRNLNPILIEHGWQAWLNEYADHATELGYKSILVHNPFGEPSNSHYRLDAYLECLADPATAHVATGFRDAWTAWRTQHPDIQVIFYLGPGHGSPILNQLARDGRHDEWEARVLDSISPIIDIQADLCLDAQVAAQPGGQSDRAYDIIHAKIAAYGGKLGVEGWPRCDINPRYATDESDFVVVAYPPNFERYPVLIPDVEGKVIILDQSSQWSFEHGIDRLRTHRGIAVNPSTDQWRYKSTFDITTQIISVD